LRYFSSISKREWKSNKKGLGITKPLNIFCWMCEVNIPPLQPHKPNPLYSVTMVNKNYQKGYFRLAKLVSTPATK
jgi:hypothetical protein